MDELRTQIRQLLLEELSRIKSNSNSVVRPPVQERVTVRNDHDLNAFARRLVALSQDAGARSNILSGKLLFSLDQGIAAQASMPSASDAHPVSVPTHVQVTKKMITERDIGLLAQGTKSIMVSKSARFTPLALDEIRRRDIKIQRAAS